MANQEQNNSSFSSPRFPNQFLVKYPHLQASDIPIWNRFLQRFRSDFIGFDYDVRVGEGIQPPPDTPPNIAKMAISLTQKRIDVVGYKRGQIWIIEVKQRPGVSAVGQLVSYTTLYRRQFNPREKLISALVSDVVEPDIRTVCLENGLIWFEV